jgi:hypothetical protein
MSQFKLKIIWPSPNMSRVASADNRKKIYFFPTSLMKMILSSPKLVTKIGVCITSEENGEKVLR